MIRPRRLAARAVGLAASASGLAAWLRRRRRRRGEYRLYVLEYHDVSGGPEPEGTVSAARLRRHVRYLKRHYRIETFAGAAARLAGPEPLDRDVVALTFDDGYAGNVRWAWPVLRDEGVPATIYLATGFLDGQELWFDVARRSLAAAYGYRVSPGILRDLKSVCGSWPPRGGLEGAMKHLKSLAPAERDGKLERLRRLPFELAAPAEPMSWDQARTLHRGGIELGAHTVTHPILPTLDRAGQEEEIVHSRERIAEELGEAPVTFSYPNGDYDETSVEVVRGAGFAAACTTHMGSNGSGADLFRLRRLGIGSDSNALLAARLAGLLDVEVRRKLARRFRG